MEAQSIRPNTFYVRTEYRRADNGLMEINPVLLVVTSVKHRGSTMTINTEEITKDRSGSTVRVVQCFYVVGSKNAELPFRAVPSHMVSDYIKAYTSYKYADKNTARFFSDFV